MPNGKGFEIQRDEALSTTVERCLRRARQVDHFARQGACGVGAQGAIEDLLNLGLVVMVESETIEAPLEQPGLVSQGPVACTVDFDLLKPRRALGARRENRNGYEKPKRPIGPHGKERMA